MSDTILVADPNIQFLDHTRQLLEEYSFNFVQALNGEEAKLKLELDKIDLCLLNASLPSISGAMLCNYIKQDLQRPIPVAFMIAQGEEIPPPDVLDLSDGLLLRPIRPKELMACIRSLQTIRNLQVQNTELRKRIQPGVPVSAPPQNAPPPPPPPAEEKKPSNNENQEPEGPLYPMNWFRKLATLEVKRAIRFHHPLSLLLMSFDLTEDYLEQYTEQEVALLSETLAKAVRQSIRDIDIPVQFSRDHVLILLPNTGIEGSIQGAARIKGAVTQILRREISPNLGPPTLSIGATTSSTQGTFKFTDLLRDATRALREVRSQGGDGVFYC